MAAAEIFLGLGTSGQFGYETVFLRGTLAGMDAIPMNNERNPILLVMLHHQNSEFLVPSYKLAVDFQGYHGMSPP
jgi:hypothetical protein